MFNFFIFVLGFVGILTATVIAAKLRVRRAVSHSISLGLMLSFLAVTFLAWWFVTKGDTIEQRIIAPLILPSPVEVLKAFPKLHFEQELVRCIIVSFKRVTIGFVLAAAIAIPLGVYMASFPPIADFFRPLELVAAYVPIVCFIPLTLAWWGISETQKIGFLFIGCFVNLLPMVIKTISDVPAAYLDVARTKGASQWQLVYKVLLPVSKADIYDHLQNIYGIGWGWIILAEIVNADKGLGYLISISERRGHTNAVFAVIVVIVMVALVSDYFWSLGGRLFFPYRKKDQS